MQIKKKLKQAAAVSRVKDQQSTFISLRRTVASPQEPETSPKKNPKKRNKP